MANTGYGVDRTLINGSTPEVEKFLDDWTDSNDYVLAHTSGSTGKPKTIPLFKADMVSSALNTCRFFRITPRSTLVLPLSADYVAGKMMIVRALVSGARLHVMEPSSHPLSGWDSTPIDLLPIVPSQITGLISSSASNTVRNIIVGGAAVSNDDEQRLRVLPGTVYATYGMTETCSHVALRSISNAETVFHALPGIVFSQDSRGCLVISGEGFSFMPVTTNDIVDLISPDRFVWLGRADNVINSGGVKIHPEEIERLIEPLMSGKNYYVTGRPSSRWGMEAVLMIEGNIADVDRLMSQIREVVPQYCVPKDIISVLKFQRTPSGKVKRRILP